MDRKLNPRRVAVALAFFLAPSLILVDVAAAQERMQVLVPALSNASGGRPNFGRDVAKEVQKRLDRMLTHQPVPNNELKDGLKKYQLKEEDLTDCIKTQQFAGLVGIPLIMCGTFTEGAGGATVKASIISPETQESFEIPEFQASSPQQAADQIVTQFEAFTQQLAQAQYCYDYVQSQQWENAIESCDKALEINPQGKTALAMKSRALYELDRDEEALSHTKQLLEVDPLNQDAMLLAGIIAAELGQIEESDRYFHEYLELNPGNKDVRLKIAADAAKAGNPEGALRILEEGMTGELANDLQMQEYAGHFAMAAANAKLTEGAGNGNEAVANALLEKALQYYEPVFASKGSEVDPVIVRNMLQAHRKLEQHDRALEFGQRAVEAYPQDAQLLSAYADALNDAGRRSEALAMLNRVTQIDPEYAINARKGLWMLQSGELAGALAALKVAAERNELDATQQDQLARQIAVTGYNEKSKVGQHQAALPYYEAAKELAHSPESRGMVAFFEGYAIFAMADARMKEQTAANARAALPQFRRVLELMQQASAWSEQASTRQNIVNATNQHIEIAELLIRRGT